MATMLNGAAVMDAALLLIGLLTSSSLVETQNLFLKFQFLPSLVSCVMEFCAEIYIIM